MSVAPWISLSDLADPAHPYGSEIIDTVSFVLYRLTGGKFSGVREVTEFYVCPDVENDPEIYELYPDFAGVKPYVTAPNRTITLHGTPVRKLIEVREGDRILDPSEYTLVNRTRLIRNDCNWNFCSGVSVTYRYGVAPPKSGMFAAITLADELVNYFNDSPNCRIPQGAVSISRQGTDIQMIDMNDYIISGLVVGKSVSPGIAR